MVGCYTQLLLIQGGVLQIFFFSLSFLPHVTQKMAFHTTTRHGTASHQMTGKHSLNANPPSLQKWSTKDRATPRTQVDRGQRWHLTRGKHPLKTRSLQGRWLVLCYTAKSPSVMGALGVGWHESTRSSPWHIAAYPWIKLGITNEQSVKIIPTFLTAEAHLR